MTAFDAVQLEDMDPKLREALVGLLVAAGWRRMIDCERARVLIQCQASVLPAGADESDGHVRQKMHREIENARARLGFNSVKIGNTTWIPAWLAAWETGRTGFDNQPPNEEAIEHLTEVVLTALSIVDEARRGGPGE